MPTYKYKCETCEKEQLLSYNLGQKVLDGINCFNCGKGLLKKIGILQVTIKSEKPIINENNNVIPTKKFIN